MFKSFPQKLKSARSAVAWPQAPAGKIMAQVWFNFIITLINEAK